MIKAIALISGGLDSMLAARVVKEHGIEVIGVTFDISFTRHRKNILDPCESAAEKAAKSAGVELRVVDVAKEFLEVLQKPKYGYGSNLNPCIDCKIFMLQKARQMMDELGASFVITGEVFGQRPMSQNKKALYDIEKDSGLTGLLLRPLSAKLMEPTIPEQNGWVNRNKLLAISGRTRRPQMELAKKFQIKDYPNAAGGCLLTEPLFVGRIKDLISRKELTSENVELIKLGRYFKISAQTRLIVGRDEKENILLEKLAQENDYLFWPYDIMGPLALGRGNFDVDEINLASRIVCRYCDLNGKAMADILYAKVPKQKEHLIKVKGLPETELEGLRI